jgi:hypothetical protein
VSAKPTAERPQWTRDDEVEYEHPNYPNARRKGTIVTSARDGAIVMDHDTRHPVRVRHKHLHVPGTTASKPTAKSLGQLLLMKAGGPPGSRIASPTARAMAGGKARTTLGKPAAAPRAANSGSAQIVQSLPPAAGNALYQGQQIWAPVSRRLPYEVGHAIQYQRPDDAEPTVGKVEIIGAHGCYVSTPQGGRRKVRWESVVGPAQVGVLPEERQDVAATLAGMGLAMDPLEQVLTGNRQPGPDAALMAQLQALAGEGAPIDVTRAASAPEDALRRLVAYLTSP